MSQVGCSNLVTLIFQVRSHEVIEMVFVIARMCMRGFTTIELAAVIAVTVVLAIMGRSAYTTYSVRAEVAEGITAARKLQGSVADLFSDSGEILAAAKVWGISTLAVVDSMLVEDGRIDIIYGANANPAIAGRRLSLTPYETATLEIVWICGNEIPGPGLDPLGFAGGGRQSVQIATTIERRYLPLECR